MESGTPGLKITSDGWMNRALIPEKRVSPVRAVSLGTDLARALRGHNEAVAIANLDLVSKYEDSRGVWRRQLREHVRAAPRQVVLNSTGRETFDAV